jgi:hypothetical protein
MGPSPILARYYTLGLLIFGWGEREMKGQTFSRREAVKTFFFEMWARMDSAQLFRVLNEWMKRLAYVIESGREYDTKYRVHHVVGAWP